MPRKIARWKDKIQDGMKWEERAEAGSLEPSRERVLKLPFYVMP